jgi:hypothetical protein
MDKGILRSALCLLSAFVAVGLAAPAPADTGKTLPKPDYVAMQAALHRSVKEYNALHPLKAPPASPGTRMGLTVLPVNVAVMAGGTVRLTCEANLAPPFSRVHWYEYVTVPGGNPQMISDNENILPSHPNAARYSIIQDTDSQFHLPITGVSLADGGAYACIDASGVFPDVIQGQGELVVLLRDPECETNVDGNGIVMEFQSYTASCRIFFGGNYAPSMTWTGPPPYQAITIPSPGDVFSGVYFTVDRGHDTGTFRLQTNFTAPTAVPPGVADNAPDYEHYYSAPTLYVYWEPKNLFHSPVKATYDVGDVITCYADAYPPPFYGWQNWITNEVINSQSFTVDARYQGLNTTMRCQAQNLIQGLLRSANIFIAVYVPPATTTTTTTTPAPTTSPPLESDCFDLSGWWRSLYPYAEILLTVDPALTGKVVGYLKNDTAQHWVEVVGRTRLNDFAYVGISAIHPYDDGITGMSGECHRCSGEEVIIVSGLQRSYSESPTCGYGGPTGGVAEYTFHRVPTSVASVVGSPDFKVHPGSRGADKVFAGIKH